jgi:hypothetical protein
LQTLARIAVVVVAAISPAWLAAQGTSDSRPGSTRLPATPHESLTVFEGSWTLVGGQAGLVSRDTCGWLAGGRRHLVCRRLSGSGDQTSEQLMVYRYRRADSAFAVTVFLAGGQIWEYAGRPEEGRWVLYLERARPDAPRLRQVIRVAGDTLHYIEEASVNGGPWQLTDPSEDYKYVKTRKPSG